MKDLLTVNDIARHLGIHHQTVRKWIVAGKLKAFMVGRRVRITPESLQEFKEQRIIKAGYCVEYKPLPEQKGAEIEITSSLLN